MKAFTKEEYDTLFKKWINIPALERGYIMAEMFGYFHHAIVKRSEFSRLDQGTIRFFRELEKAVARKEGAFFIKEKN